MNSMENMHTDAGVGGRGGGKLKNIPRNSAPVFFEVACFKDMCDPAHLKKLRKFQRNMKKLFYWLPGKRANQLMMAEIIPWN